MASGCCPCAKSLWRQHAPAPVALATSSLLGTLVDGVPVGCRCKQRNVNDTDAVQQGVRGAQSRRSSVGKNRSHLGVSRCAWLLLLPTCALEPCQSHSDACESATRHTNQDERGKCANTTSVSGSCSSNSPAGALQRVPCRCAPEQLQPCPYFTHKGPTGITQRTCDCRDDAEECSVLI